MNLYYVISQSIDPYENLALEALLMQAVPADSVILYLWQNHRTVVIGRNQNPWAECRTALLEADGGHLARRTSGGGAVYHDLGNLNFTFLCPEALFDIPRQLSVIQTACGDNGINAQFSGRNDLLTDGKKFSGNAFYHSKGQSCHHGTILLHSDMEMLGRYLSPSKAKLSSKGVASVRSRVVNLCQLNPKITCQSMQDSLLQAFSRIYGGTPVLLPQLSQLQARLGALREEFASQAWLYGKPMPFTCAMEGRLSWGSLELRVQVEGGVIQGCQVYTDAMDPSLPEKIRLALQGCRFETQAMIHALSSLGDQWDMKEFISCQNI